MTKEIEGHILNVNPEDIIQKLEELGAEKTKAYNFRRYVFDTIPATPNRWVRLRTDGHETTLAVKEITSQTADGTSEWEVITSDIDTTLQILEKIGISPRGYQENTRQEFILDGDTLSIDTWPKLQPFIEIEAQSEAQIIAIAAKLGFSSNDISYKDVDTLYTEIGINLKTTPKLTFN